MAEPEHKFLKIVLDALKNDVPRQDYSKLSRYTVQLARKELTRALEVTPGANFDNVYYLRAQLSIAEQGQWSNLDKQNIEAAVSEYNAVMDGFKYAKENKINPHATSNIEHKQPERQNTGNTSSDRGVQQNNEREDHRYTGLKKVDTAESMLIKRAEQSKLQSENEEVPEPTLKKVDTAEMLLREKAAHDHAEHDLLSRSQKAVRELHVANPSITDLSDSNRPVKLAEMFTELYDNEWTDAMEELTRMNKSEIEAIEILLNYVTHAFDKCKEVADKRRSEMTKELHRTKDQAETEFEVQEKMKRVTDEQMDDLKETIGDKVGSQNNSQIVRCYIDECVRLTYLMNIQNPPMVLHIPTVKEEFKPDLYKEYTRTGKTVKYVVWPALLLCAGGPVVTKGVVQLE